MIGLEKQEYGREGHEHKERKIGKKKRQEDELRNKLRNRQKKKKWWGEGEW